MSLNTMNTIMQELQTCIEQINPKDYNSLVQILNQDTRFHFYGEGRSGLVAKMIAMRCMHSGKQAFVIGETISPPLKEGDVLLLVSGSAKTNAIRFMADRARNMNVQTVLITANKETLQDHLFSHSVWIAAATKYRRENEPTTIQPLGNQFDQVAHILLDAAIIDSSEPTTNMFENHMNME